MRDWDVAEDVAQQVFVRLWERRGSLELEGSLRGLLYRMARNLCLDELRRRSARARAAERATENARSATPDDYLIDEELRTAVANAVNALPSRRRDVFLLVRHHGLTYREVAQTLGLAPQTVANHMSLALADLRRTLGSHLKDRLSESARVPGQHLNRCVAGAGGS